MLWISSARMVDAGTNVWTSLGLGGESVDVLAIDPSTPSTLYAGTRGGVFKSTTGGRPWRPVNTGLTDLAVLALAIDSHTPPTVYAGTVVGGVFALTNAATCLGTGTAHIRGRITRDGGLLGVPDSAVILDGPGECGDLTTTGALGFFHFSTLEDGAYTLTPLKTGCTFSPPSQDVTIAG